MEELRYVRLSRRQRFWIWLVAAVLLFTALAVLAVLRMKPVLLQVASTRASNMVSRIVNAAVNEAMAAGKLDYDDLVTLETGAQGSVIALKSNMMAANRLQSEISADVLRRLGDISTTDLRIPIGTLSGIALLAGRGPALTIRMQTVGSAEANFRNEFTSAGINQTKHRILLDVDVYVSILLPGFYTSTKVSSEVAVAETVIVGSVPETYTYFQALPESLDEYAQEYIMNNG